MDELEIKENPEFEKLTVRFRQLGWTAIVLLLIAAALGWSGPSPFTQRQVQDENGTISFDQVLRAETPATLKVELPTPKQDQVRIWLSQEYLDQVQVESTQPEALSVKASQRGLSFLFGVQPGAPARFYFRLIPQGWGRIKGAIQIDDGKKLIFHQTVLF